MAIEAVAVERTVATGWRRHPGRGTDPAKPELVADFTTTLELDVAGPRHFDLQTAPVTPEPVDLAPGVKLGPRGTLEYLERAGGN
ncbi:hypothetical protein QRX50_30880 [Amycolatopsis carbonis]|uniref:Uncharacterized protein n=1 Tax=Amycolatopsis carbonis TaxID=715471 RepID=A0A9Y2IAU0_9PSEU|nr:hypothetical protein [Amycolatopsis sp. 2-15]WIX75871.1 hypothetical protein QRX50_30880 [Amycolatopsis sp. 2-15]